MGGNAVVDSKNKRINSESFLVRITLGTLNFSKERTLGRLVEKKWPDSWFAIECYVLTWFAAATFLYPMVHISNIGGIFYFWLVIVVLGGYRLYEIISFHAFELIKPDNHNIHSAQRSFILAAINYAEIVLWFGIFYSIMNIQGLIEAKNPASIAILHESIVFMLCDSGRGIVLRENYWSWLVVTIQSVIGLFMTLVVITRFVSLLPASTSQDSS